MGDTEKNKCPQCDITFNSEQELQEHQKTCKRPNLAPGTSGVTAQPATEADKTATDMLVEDRFQATDH